MLTDITKEAAFPVGTLKGLLSHELFLIKIHKGAQTRIERRHRQINVRLVVQDTCLNPTKAQRCTPRPLQIERRTYRKQVIPQRRVVKAGIPVNLNSYLSGPSRSGDQHLLPIEIEHRRMKVAEILRHLARCRCIEKLK